MRENRNDEEYENFCRADFRMSSNKFCGIIELIGHALENKIHNFAKQFLLKKQVVIAIKRLATSNSCRTIGKTFTVAKSIAISTTNDFCCGMMNLVKYFIKFA